MSNQEFRDLVFRMRDTQKKYFASKNLTLLKASKVLEEAVDEELSEVKSPKEQLKLF